MNDNTFSITVGGKEYIYQIIKTLRNNKLKHNYIIYTDGNDVYSSRYTIFNNDVVLEDIENDEEWTFIDNYLENNGGDLK